ncbi:RrF2 family transcriptional regulator [Clostridium septicum]|uniref:Rrf2 family transcriptional regulator n=1 Tax=Clostridium septicum TaxID=1504 RepID=A0A9N7PJ06_CLOSE|nr:Rrf2 family transcriptional regulator [Clostridium septicum]AYE34245.1 Rrf2 family transcriptional regulator [Clostridium septicum]MDU1313274.1 Rrf2 family transcriptional regulator [Clostridium septicum]QAS59651.1 Rrf2 family transcriptional regulator [Clostridium septicum]UEC21120.1 Rrf2 family transcriptional regulator [Clostridium septicum]USS00831.1 Rrf2 family transcriptional regulator [Clostridium septicum]
MKISTKGRYGLRALIDISIYSFSETVTLKSISERQDISERYLEQIFSSLRKGGVIKSKKGPQGGYFLSEEANNLTIGEILRILEGDSNLINIEETDNEMEKFICENLWEVANKRIKDFFNSITLEELSTKYKESTVNIMYYI